MEKDGVERTFTGIGDAAANNVAPAMQLCLVRMAETRSKARALRDAVNIGVAAFEELSEEDAYDGAPERGYQVGSGRSSRPGGVRVTAANRPSAAPASTGPAAPRLTTVQGGAAELPGNTNPITENQVNAIRNLCRRAGLEADAIASEKFKVDSLQSLTQAQAGELIRSLSAHGNGRSPAATV
jgi:hypothetical protein